MSESALKLVADEFCFVCGPGNAAGLQARFQTGKGTASTRFVPQLAHQGYARIIHGGILAALLDEAMVYASVTLGCWVATAELTIRYQRPSAPGVPLLVTARVTRDTRRLVECEAEIRDETGEQIANATGRLIKGEPLAE